MLKKVARRTQAKNDNSIGTINPSTKPLIMSKVEGAARAITQRVLRRMVATAASRQKLHHCPNIERPAKLRTIVDAPQYRDAHAVFFEQAVVVGDIDMLRNDPCLTYDCFCLLAQVAARGAVEFYRCFHHERPSLPGKYR